MGFSGINFPAKGSGLSGGLLIIQARLIEVVSGKYRESVVVVPFVDDLIHGVANPIRRYCCSKFIQNKYVRLIDWREHSKFR